MDDLEINNLVSTSRSYIKENLMLSELNKQRTLILEELFK